MMASLQMITPRRSPFISTAATSKRWSALPLSLQKPGRTILQSAQALPRHRYPYEKRATNYLTLVKLAAPPTVSPGAERRNACRPDGRTPLARRTLIGAAAGLPLVSIGSWFSDPRHEFTYKLATGQSLTQPINAGWSRPAGAFARRPAAARDPLLSGKPAGLRHGPDDAGALGRHRIPQHRWLGDLDRRLGRGAYQCWVRLLGIRSGMAGDGRRHRPSDPRADREIRAAGRLEGGRQRLPPDHLRRKADPRAR